tara:strand:- start:662 stop:1279 length:618 start_codon:yes stop_codon:yes gene_type:complete
MAIVSNGTTMADAGAFSGVLGAMTLIKTVTASDGDATVAFEDGSASVVLDSTYPIYRITISGAHPEEDGKYMTMQFNAAGGSGYDETLTTTMFRAFHFENDAADGLGYNTSHDLAQSTSRQNITEAVGAGADEACSGEIWLFNPSSTTFVKHFTTRMSPYYNADGAIDWFTAGYINTTSAIDEVNFSFSSGDVDAGTFKLYGIKD